MDGKLPKNGGTFVVKIKFFTDPGHGWLRVPLPMLLELNIAGEISRYSYYDKEHKAVFLEEDRDARIFVKAANKAGLTLVVSTSHTNRDSWIRRLPSYEYSG